MISKTPERLLDTPSSALRKSRRLAKKALDLHEIERVTHRVETQSAQKRQEKSVEKHAHSTRKVSRSESASRLQHVDLPYQSLPWDVFVSELLQQLLCKTEGKALRWDGESCVFVDGPHLPHLEALLAHVNPLIQCTNSLRDVFAQREQLPSLCGQGVHCVIQKMLNGFTSATAALLRSEKVTKSQLHSFVSQYAGKVHFLAYVIRSTKEKSGGDILQACVDMRASTIEKDILEEITLAATRPYFAMLRTWVCDGRLEDPFGELLVRSAEIAESSLHQLWEVKFTLNMQKLPPQSIPGVAMTFSEETLRTILLVGKLVDFLRQLRPAERIDSADFPKEFGVTKDWEHSLLERRALLCAKVFDVFREERFVDKHVRLSTDFLLLQNSDFATHLSERIVCSGMRENGPNMTDVIRSVLEAESDRHLEAFGNAFAHLSVEKTPAVKKSQSSQLLWMNALPRLLFAPKGLASLIFTPELCGHFTEINAFLLRLRVIDQYLTEIGQALRAKASTSKQGIQMLWKCQKFIRALLQYFTYGVLHPHITALHAALKDTEMLSKFGCIEGLQWVFVVFVQNIKRCLLIETSTVNAPLSIQKCMAAVNSVDAISHVDSANLSKPFTQMLELIDIPRRASTVFTKIIESDEETRTIQRCVAELQEMLQKAVKAFFDSLETPKLADLRCLEHLQTVLHAAGFVR